MICYRCGHNVPDKSMRCSNCGAELGSATRAMKIPRGSLKALRQRRAATAGAEIPFKAGDPIAGRYEVRETLGKSSFGVVFKTFDRELESEVAVKVFDTRWFEDDQAQARFEAAVRQARRLSHQNIVRLYDSGFDREHAFVAMQFLEGLNLARVLKLRTEKQEPFGLDEIEPLLQQLDKSLDLCHRSGFHGDLKPENIILLPERLKITDFFIREAIGAAAFVKEMEGSVYLAPEIKADSQAGDGRSDIYSVAVITAELLGGRPFEDELILPCANNPTLPPEVDQIIAQATAVDPAARFASVAAFIEALLAVHQPIELLGADDAILEIGEDDLVPSDTAVYKLEKPPAAPMAPAVIDPLDIPTPLDIGEGPGDGDAILLDGDLDILDEDDVSTTAVPALQRPVEPSPLMATDELTTTEQPREAVLAAAASMMEAAPAPEKPAASTSTSGRKSKKGRKGKGGPASTPDIFDVAASTAPQARGGFMKPTGTPDKAEEKPTPRAEEDRSLKTERVRALPPIKPRGEVAQERGGKMTMVLATLSILLLIGVAVFVLYSQGKIERKTEKVTDFGQKVTTSAPVTPSGG